MKIGDLVRCKIWGKVGIIVGIPRHADLSFRPGSFKLVRVLWSSDVEPVIEHINNVEVINEAG